MTESARDLLSQGAPWLSDIGRHIAFFLFQRVSVVTHLSVVQRFNSVLLHDSFCVEDQPD